MFCENLNWKNSKLVDQRPKLCSQLDLGILFPKLVIFYPSCCCCSCYPGVVSSSPSFNYFAASTSPGNVPLEPELLFISFVFFILSRAVIKQVTMIGYMKRKIKLFSLGDAEYFLTVPMMNEKQIIGRANSRHCGISPKH